MAPSRGSYDGGEPNSRASYERLDDPLVQHTSRDDVQHRLAERAAQPQNFTIRGVVCGLVIGIVVVFSNMYFGLQTGWISGMSMPSALIAFAFFKTMQRFKIPFIGSESLSFSPVENVFIQSVSGSVGTMPLGCGFVGVIPALEFLLRPGENGPIKIDVGRLCMWAVGICLFGVVLAVPLRREVIIREKLKFPSGTATALMIEVLHGQTEGATVIRQDDGTRARASGDESEHQALMAEERRQEEVTQDAADTDVAERGQTRDDDKINVGNWKTRIRSLLLAFVASAAYTILSYFVPQIRRIPIFGSVLSETWLWTLNPSPAYIGQGIIMGPATTAHMLLGAIIGWGILSPLAKSKGWATGPVDSWETGSKGWIVWVSLAIMLADAIVSLAFLVARPIALRGPSFLQQASHAIHSGDWRRLLHARLPPFDRGNQSSVGTRQQTPARRFDPSTSKRKGFNDEDEPEADAPSEHLISTRSFVFWLVVSILLYFVSIHLSFPNILPFSATVTALILASLLSLVGVRALGETDLNPVSGISKITQLVFAAVIPASNPNAIGINIIAGAVAESGALQAGDLMQDLKTGHLLGAAPNAQFYGQIIGSVVGAALSAVVYKLYTGVYEIPSKQFPVPTAYVWWFTARLVMGDGLPDKATEFAVAAAAVFAVVTVLRTLYKARNWQAYIPGGIAVAVGMYNEPNFTLARAIGGLVSWAWVRRSGRSETSVVVLASGLILGEGLFSILNLGLASAKVPHA